MGKVPFKVVIIVLFVIIAFLTMFFDAQLHIDFKSKPSMVFLHGAHHAESESEHDNSDGHHDGEEAVSGGHDH